MSDPPSIGGIRLHDAVVPDLAAGLYRVRSGLAVTEGGTDLTAPDDQDACFQIAAPRFAFAPGEIADCFPPPGAKGAFSRRLPHVSLGRRTLPWERQSRGSDEPGQAPWLALLVLRPDEMTISAGTVRTSLPAPIVTELENREPIDGDPAINVLQINSLDTMNGVMPSHKETALLAHVRQVNMADTMLASDDDDGWFATIAANRLPSVGGDAVETPFVACLVSLEAREDVWSPSAPLPPPLVLLHSWTFATATEGGTFSQFAAGLDIAAFGQAGADHGLLDEFGRIAMRHTRHDGQTVDARYRGPLAGSQAQPAEAGQEPDVSFAAAFELGRLLGIADGRFLRELVEWHRKAESKVRARLEADEIAAHADLAVSAASVYEWQKMLVAEIDSTSIAKASVGRLTLPDIES